MSRFGATVVAFLALMGSAAALAQSPAVPESAQTSATPAAPAQPAAPEGDAAREALRKKEGDVDSSKLLKDTLTATNKEYSLLQVGKWDLNFDANYSFIGQERINADFSSGQLTLFNIENESQHTLTNQLTVDYGLRNDITLNASLPLISKYTQNTQFSGLSHSLGDIGVGARWQPLGVSRGWPTLTVNAGARLPTGNSPFEGVAGMGQASGSGVWSFSAGVNANKVIDPVALFGSVNFGFARPATGLSQVRGSRVLTEVKPGQSIGFSFGMAYALSYTISTSMSFQENWSRSSKLSFADGSSASTQQQTSGVFSLGLGVRVSPQTTVNTTVGIGLTSDTPNFSIGVSFPLRF
jgi:hypothetical protein